MEIRTDLALEVIEGGASSALAGIKTEEKQLEHGVKRLDVSVLDERGVQAIGKPVGKYITIEAKEVAFRDLTVQKYAGSILSEALKDLLREELGPAKQSFVTLVVGLGNRGMTADALGPKTCDKLIVTRHIYDLIQRELDKRLQSVCAISPGVLGVTGIETFDVVKGIVDRIKPDVVVTVDSLASRKTARISTTYQLTNTGIVPGGGLANARMEFSKKSLGVPVIAVGVPMVVYAATIAHDVIEELTKELPPIFQRSAESKEHAVKNTVSEVVGDLVVTPKDIDKIVDDASFVIGTGLNLALHPQLNVDDVISYMH